MVDPKELAALERYDYRTDEHIAICEGCVGGVPHAYLDFDMPDGTKKRMNVCFRCFWNARDHFTAVQEFQMGICQEPKCKYCIGTIASGGYDKEAVN